jgi:hypothetical protein
MNTDQHKQATQGVRPICGLPVDAECMFSDKKGVYRKRLEKNKTRLLEKLAFLGRFLDPDEHIVYVAPGCSPFSALEQMTIGAAWVYMIKRALLVFTNKRMFHIPTSYNLGYRGSIAQVLYQDCNRLRVKGSTLLIEYRSGKKERFYGIPGPDRGVINRLNVESGDFGPASPRPERTHLCPSCTQPLERDTSACPSCGLEFRTKAKAWKYSLLIPGGGYFYTRHPFMGMLDAIVESYLLILTAVTGLAALSGDPEAGPVAIVFAVLLAFEKLLTVYHSNSFLDEFIPTDVKPLLAGQTVCSVAPPAAAQQEPETDLVAEPVAEAPPEKIEDVLRAR